MLWRITDEALIAETAVWPNFFLMNIFFALKGSKLFIIISDTEKDNEDSKDYLKFPKETKSTFISPSGRDSTLDFYIEAITHEILQNNKRYKYRSNPLTEEQIALTSL